MQISRFHYCCCCILPQSSIVNQQGIYSNIIHVSSSRCNKARSYNNWKRDWDWLGHGSMVETRRRMVARVVMKSMEWCGYLHCYFGVAQAHVAINFHNGRIVHYPHTQHRETRWDVPRPGILLLKCVHVLSTIPYELNYDWIGSLANPEWFDFQSNFHMQVLAQYSFCESHFVDPHICSGGSSSVYDGGRRTNERVCVFLYGGQQQNHGGIIPLTKTKPAREREGEGERRVNKLISQFVMWRFD